MIKVSIFRKFDYLLTLIIRKYLKFAIIMYLIAFACFFYSIFYVLLNSNPETPEPRLFFNIINFYIPCLVFKGLLKIHTYICLIILIKFFLEPKRIIKRIFCFVYILLVLIPLSSFEFPLISNFLANYIENLRFIYIPFLIIGCVSLYIHKLKAKRNNEELF